MGHAHSDGSLFTLGLLLFEPVYQSDAVHTGLVDGEAKRGRVLVVDDEPLIVELLERILRHHHDVSACTIPTEALARVLGGERFDVILCDVMMPRLTGMDVHAAMMRNCREQADRMVFVTGGATRDDTESFLASVSNVRLYKPFSVDVVLEVVRRLVG